VEVHLPGVHSAADEQHRRIGGQPGGGQDVNRDRGVSTLIRQVQHPSLEVHFEAGGGEPILLKLAGHGETLGGIGQGRELGPPVGHRREKVRSRLGVPGRQRREFVHPPAGRIRPHLGDRGAHRVHILHRQPGIDHLGIPLTE
jgi:hypothetical protein